MEAASPEHRTRCKQPWVLGNGSSVDSAETTSSGCGRRTLAQAVVRRALAQAISGDKAAPSPPCPRLLSLAPGLQGRCALPHVLHVGQLSHANVGDSFFTLSQ